MNETLPASRLSIYRRYAERELDILDGRGFESAMLETLTTYGDMPEAMDDAVDVLIDMLPRFPAYPELDAVSGMATLIRARLAVENIAPQPNAPILGRAEALSSFVYHTAVASKERAGDDAEETDAWDAAGSEEWRDAAATGIGRLARMLAVRIVDSCLGTTGTDAHSSFDSARLRRLFATKATSAAAVSQLAHDFMRDVCALADGLDDRAGGVVTGA